MTVRPNARLLSRTRNSRVARMLVGVATIGMLTACSSDGLVGPTASVPARNDGLLTGVATTVTGAVKGLVGALGLQRRTEVKAPIVKSMTFTKSGGKLAISELGFVLNVPANAIPGNTLTITVTALPGKMVAYDFQPHGTKFLKPITFEQDLGNTLFSAVLGKPTLSGGYFKDNSQLNMQSNTALLDEVINATVSGNKVTFGISHFSGYMVSTGRSSSPSDD